ncbi:hypothetical protein M569_05986, partial [Genlisea aurea]
LQRDYVKWRGVLFLRFLLCLVDDSEKIRRLADFLFGNILKAKAPLLAYNSFVEAIFVLNDCNARTGRANPEDSRNGNRLFCIRGNDEKSRSQRRHIYQTLLKQMSPEHLLATFAKVCAEILAAASEGTLHLEDAAGLSVVQDAFSVLSCKEIRIQSGHGASSEAADEEEVGDGGGSSSSSSLSRGKAITQGLRKGLIQNSIPIFIELKRLLESRNSPLIGSLMDCLRILLKDYKNEIDDMMVADRQLQKELIHDMQRYDGLKAKKAAAFCTPRSKLPENIHRISKATAKSVLREVENNVAATPLSEMRVPKLKSTVNRPAGETAGGVGGVRPSVDVIESLRRRKINKDEALRCIGIAKEAIAAGNKERALKFIGIARRLNENLPLDDLLASCEKLDSDSATGPREEASASDSSAKVQEEDSSSVNGGERSYTEEHVQLVRQIKSKKDYYEILGLERTCSVEEIRKAYRKLSLKVHPDKNTAPGSEEAFKKVGKAFKCLSEDESRQQYDQTGLVDDFERSQQQHHVRRRRRRTGNDFYGDDFDPDEIFRAFFGDRDVFRTGHVYRTRAHPDDRQRESLAGGGPNLMLLLQLLPFLLLIILAYLPFSEPQYSLQKNYSYQFKKTTEKHGVEFFVKSPEFDDHFPVGSPGRNEVENNVIRDYKQVLGRYCNLELQRRQWNRYLQTPHCDRLESF